jgi:hypothetical protein
MDRKLMRKFGLPMRQAVLRLAMMDENPYATFNEVSARAEAYLKWIDAGKLTHDESHEILVTARVFGRTTQEVLAEATKHREWLTAASPEIAD